MGTLSASTSRTTALLPALGLFLAALAVGLGMRHVPGLAAWQRDQLTTPTLTAVTVHVGVAAVALLLTVAYLLRLPLLMRFLAGTQRVDGPPAAGPEHHRRPGPVRRKRPPAGPRGGLTPVRRGLSCLGHERLPRCEPGASVCSAPPCQSSLVRVHRGHVALGLGRSLLQRRRSGTVLRRGGGQLATRLLV